MHKRHGINIKHNNCQKKCAAHSTQFRKKKNLSTWKIQIKITHHQLLPLPRPGLILLCTSLLARVTKVVSNAMSTRGAEDRMTSCTFTKLPLSKGSQRGVDKNV